MKIRTTHIILIIAFAILSLSQLQAQFVKQNSGTQTDLNTVWFLNSDTGFVAGFDGVLLRTTNGGRRWEPILTKTNYRINSVCFLTVDTGFVVGENGIFKKTNDGGITWDNLVNDSEVDYTAIQFLGDDGFVIGHGVEGAVFGRSINKGETWEFKFINENHTGGIGDSFNDYDDIYLMNISFLNEDCGIIGGFRYNFTYGKSPFICKTTNGGKTFEDISPYDKGVAFYEGKEVVAVNYVSAHDAFAVLNNASGTEFLHLSDYRVETFETLDNITNLNSRGMYYTSSFLGRFIGYFSGIIDGTSQIVKTTDQGGSFMYLNPPTENSLYASFFPDVNTGFFVGEEGTILRLEDRDNVVFNPEVLTASVDELPFSVAVPKSNKKRTQIHIYNVNVEQEKQLDIALYDHNGSEVDIKNTRVKLYADEIRMKIKTNELNSNTYFYTIKYKQTSILNGKIILGSYAQNLN